MAKKNAHGNGGRHRFNAAMRGMTGHTAGFPGQSRLPLARDTSPVARIIDGKAVMVPRAEACAAAPEKGRSQPIRSNGQTVEVLVLGRRRRAAGN